ncbi:hypothetical protein BFP70_01870 [Thioclava sp. SK-1]|uniref:hypothetical protein n=1 Tax=Thioclava sp. SK-1 TaxID=1889770 RepID=UPI0008266455|nr:hypothetical protein [Thioclava sp. SK-1]OCX67361.1 hypothetical protein BFP70_01870 [Thioclava sp. SK-1]
MADDTTAAPPPPPPAISSLRAAGYMLTAVVLALAQGFGQNIVSANVQQLQGTFGATLAETSWLVAAYMAPNVSLSVALVKIRAQYGLRNFAELSILGFLLAALLNYAAQGLIPNVAVRFLSGVAAAPMTSLAFLYMLEPLPPARKITLGLSCALTLIFLGSPLTRLVSPYLLDMGLWHGLTNVELSLAAIGFGLIYLLPLASPPRSKVLESADLISFTLLAFGMGSMAVVFTLGATYWWLTQMWIGWLLAAAIAAIAISVVIELNRKAPLLDIRWITSPANLHFAGAILLFRFLLSEQGGGAAKYLTALGYQNSQMAGLWIVIAAGTALGGLICAVTMKPGREPWFHVVALLLLIAGSILDSQSTSAAMPEQFYLSQGMIGLASGLFLPPAMMRGFMAAFAKGRDYILNFIIIFLVTQKLGALMGSALFATGIKIRSAQHLADLYAGLPATDPQVTDRISAVAQQLSPVIGDASLSSAQASAQLASAASTQATVLAYNDAFATTALAASVTLLALLIHIAIDADRARRSTANQPSAGEQTS